MENFCIALKYENNICHRSSGTVSELLEMAIETWMCLSLCNASTFMIFPYTVASSPAVVNIY